MRSLVVGLFAHGVQLTWESPVYSVDSPVQQSLQLHSWILQIIGTQVQLSQTRGGGADNWGQSFTASLWQLQPFSL